MRKIISIDHGNRFMKTIDQVFPSSYLENGYLPSIGGDVLEYEGKVYTIVDQSLRIAGVLL